MTREEAIDRLKEARAGHKEFLSIETLNMAIKALEQEPKWILCNEKLIHEYISKVECCDACFASVFCTLNGLRKSRVPQDYCIENVKKYFENKASLTGAKSEVKGRQEQEPKTGHWIPVEYPTGVEAFGVKEMSAQMLMCSECGEEVDISDGDFKYCPYCKAKMEVSNATIKPQRIESVESVGERRRKT